jgi:endo-1,4-beta-mannosidase
MTEKPFVHGVNYWPQKAAMFMWRQFDRSSIREDMAIIGDLGFSCVRIFPLWEHFQPKPKIVPPAMLDQLVEVLEMAGDSNLNVMVTLFAGHMNGLNWLPPWMLMASTERSRYKVFSMDKVRTNKIMNQYVDSEIMEAQIFFLRELTSAVSGHPALYAWNLGNEPSLWAIPPDEFSAELWLQAMTETLKEKDDTVPITLGLHVNDLTESGGLKPRLVAKYLDYLAIHVPPGPVPWAKDPLDAALPSFLGCIVGWLGNMPVFVQDFGVATEPVFPKADSRDLERGADLVLVSEEDSARMTAEVWTRLRRFKMMGGFWKTYGDYHPSIWAWPPLDEKVSERFCGLVRYDRSPKPAASVLESRPTGAEENAVFVEWIDLPEEDYYRDPRQQLARLYRRFREYYSFE